MRKIDVSRYTPDFLLEIEEFKFIVPKINAEFERLYAAIDELMLNQYISTMNEYTLHEFEKQLGIILSEEDTIENRRSRILAKYNMALPYTYRAVCEFLESLCGENNYLFWVDGYTVIVKIELIAKKQIKAAGDMLINILPANLILDLDLEYNRYWKLGNLKHGELTRYTYGDLRDEVLKHEENE